MNARQIFSIMAMCVAFMASAQDATNNRTQEQFQQELTQFGEETRAMMMQEYILALNEEHKQLLKQTKNIINKTQNMIFLPLEVNKLLGDTTTKTNYIVKPMWKNGYFTESDSTALIVPLYNESLQLLQCQLRAVSFENKVCSIIIETLIGTFDNTNSNFTGSMIYSLSSGNFIEIYSFKNGECTEIIQNECGRKINSYNYDRFKPNYRYTDLYPKTLQRVSNEKNKQRPLNWEDGERRIVKQENRK